MCLLDLRWLARKDYRVISSLAEFRAQLAIMKRYKLIAVDTETTGLMIYNLSDDNKLKDTIAGICISWRRNQGIYIPLAHTQFKNLDKRTVLQELMPILEEKMIVTHNGLYDGKVFYSEGIRLNICHDTLLLYFNIDSNISRGSKGLKPLTEKLYNYEVIEFSDIFESSKDYGLFRYLDKELVRAYACGDSDHTLQLFLDSFGFLDEGQRRSYALDIKVQNELIRSEYYGKGVDLELCRAMSEINNTDMEKLSDAIYKYAHYLICKQANIPYDSGKYIFNIASSDELKILFYDLLKYTPLKYNPDTGQPSVDKYVLKSMLRDEQDGLNEIETEIFKDTYTSSIVDAGLDWVDVTDKKTIKLADKDEIVAKKYKICSLISTWRRLDKFRSSFFNPLLNNNFEGKYFSSISMTRTQTARLVDPIQTMVGYLKRLIVPYKPDKEYLVDFDFAQIEYRTMAGESGIGWLVDRLRNPEADYHREGGSLILNKAPEDITGSERSGIKAVNFGIPYDMSAQGIVGNRYGIGHSKAKMDEYIAEVEQLLVSWHKSLYQISDMLNRYRDQACTLVSDDKLPPPLKGKKIGIIHNALGRTRVFYLDKVDGSEMEKSDFSRIRRQAGNFPIQSFAREVYCMAIVKLCARLKKEGLCDVRVKDDSKASGYRFDNKVVITSYIHDECLMNVDKSVDPNRLHKIIYEECMLLLKGHPNYYAGVNVINNWYEGKDDRYEAPVEYARRQASRLPEGENSATYDSNCNQRDVVLSQIKEYIGERGMDEVKKYVPDIEKTHYVDMRKIQPLFKNYFIKPKLLSFYGLWRDVLDLKKKPDAKNYKTQFTWELYEKTGRVEDDFTTVLLETFLVNALGTVTIQYTDDYFVVLHSKDMKEFVAYPSVQKESVSDREGTVEEEFDRAGPSESEAIVLNSEMDEDIVSSNSQQLMSVGVKDTDLTSLFDAVMDDEENSTILNL